MENTQHLTFDDIAAYVADGEPQTELLTLIELTGNTSYTERWAKHITGPNPWDHTFPDNELSAMREELTRAIYGSLHDELQKPVDDALVGELIDASQGENVSAEYHRLIKKEMGLKPDTVEWTAGRPKRADAFRVIIIGAGPSGITAAIRMKKLGINFQVFDTAEDFGGTWLQNTYPGCGVDIASHYFSFSFDQDPNWQRYYAKQPEILRYIRGAAERAGIRENAQFNTEVLSTEYLEDEKLWVVTARSESEGLVEHRAEAVISAAGLLTVPKIPEFRGLEVFQKPYFHAAQWDHSIDYAGKRVALIGAGASANQIGPTMCPEVEELTVVQRSAQWNIGVPNYMEEVTDGEKWLLANIVEYQRWFRARTMLSQNDSLRKAAVADPEWNSNDGSISEHNAKMRAELVTYIKDELGDRQDLLPMAVPDYPPFTKRMLRDNGWYRMMRRKNVEVVSGKSISFTEDSVVDDEGVEHHVDLCVFATGFESSRMLGSYNVTGRRGVSIRDLWGEEDPRAHYGITVPGFPNFFILYGPNTNIGTGGSIILQAETWSRYAAECIVHLIESGAAAIECRHDAMRAYNEHLDQRLSEMVWSVSSGSSWYRNSAGRVVATMPWTTPEYWTMTQSVDLADYIFTDVTDGTINYGQTTQTASA